MFLCPIMIQNLLVLSSRRLWEKNLFHLAPYHSATNSLTERAVQSFKCNVEKNTEGAITTQVACFLFTYCRTPHTMSGVTPSELLLGRIPQSHLDHLKPATTLWSSACISTPPDRHAGLRFTIVDPIMEMLCYFWNLEVCANSCE